MEKLTKNSNTLHELSLQDSGWNKILLQKDQGFLNTHPKQIKLELQDFWRHFGGKANYGKGFPEEEKLSWLKKYSHKRYFIRRGSRSRLRSKFTKPYKRFTRLFNRKCFVCNQLGEIRHHIIMLLYGGDNRNRNLLTLCGTCHAKIHVWLSSETLGNVSLAL